MVALHGAPGPSADRNCAAFLGYKISHVVFFRRAPHAAQPCAHSKHRRRKVSLTYIATGSRPSMCNEGGKTSGVSGRACKVNPGKTSAQQNQDGRKKRFARRPMSMTNDGLSTGSFPSPYLPSSAEKARSGINQQQLDSGEGRSFERASSTRRGPFIPSQHPLTTPPHNTERSEPQRSPRHPGRNLLLRGTKRKEGRLPRAHGRAERRQARNGRPPRRFSRRLPLPWGEQPRPHARAVSQEAEITLATPRAKRRLLRAHSLLASNWAQLRTGGWAGGWAGGGATACTPSGSEQALASLSQVGVPGETSFG